MPLFASDARVDEVAPAAITARLAAVRSQEAGAAKRSEEAIHEMRVAARRLRAALKLFAVNGELSAAVKRLQDVLGSVRDLQVQAKWLAKERELLRRLESRLPAKEKLLNAELETWREETADRITRRAAGKFSERVLGGRYFRKLMRQSLCKLKRRLKAFHDAPEPLAAHQLRIAAKQLRYQTEILRNVWPRRTGKMIDRLMALQDLFGELHDADVRLSLLVQLGAAKGLLERAQSDRDRRARKALKTADEWRHKGRVQRWMRYFAD